MPDSILFVGMPAYLCLNSGFSTNKRLCWPSHYEFFGVMLEMSQPNSKRFHGLQNVL
jgi:hypothetical protein